MTKKNQLTPMMQQYVDLKSKYPDCLLFFRLGDFYEMFFEDALTASRELAITLTGRDCGMDERAPMCGVPYHAAAGYIDKLIKKGYKVAIGEQVEEVAEAKGIVKRDVIRVVTPGTHIDSHYLEASKHNYLVAITLTEQGYGFSLMDMTTGDFRVTTLNNQQSVIDEVAKFGPTEIVLAQTLMEDTTFVEQVQEQANSHLTVKELSFFGFGLCQQLLKEQFKVSHLEGLGHLTKAHIMAAGGLLHYVLDTQKIGLTQCTDLQIYQQATYMLIDPATRRNLELIETMREKEKKGSLLWVLDSTQTAMGGRLLRSFIEQPLVDKELIDQRLTAVDELFGQPFLNEEIREVLQPIYDLERLMTRIAMNHANPRDMLAFKQSLAMLPTVAEMLEGLTAELFVNLADNFDQLIDMHDLLECSLAPEPPVSLKEGYVIRDGFNNEIDELRSASANGKQWLNDLEERERQATGIKNLKVRYNKVFGYYIEVTKANIEAVPEHYQRKQTLTNSERYSIPELKDYENTILGAEEKLIRLETAVFQEVRNVCNEGIARVKRVASALAYLDVLQSLAMVARKQGYVKPTIDYSGRLSIVDGRHPVIEKMMDENQFIVNSTYLDLQQHRISIITGPNMSGKSTYMRQVALISLMGQIGSFVPAGSAELCLIDRLFTRVGASDDLASGKSTFMVEMTEVANILRNSTKKSLIILDEIGRGTSTFDGLSIAWAVVEYLASQIGAKTLFATHYHELSELEGKIEGVQNYCILVKEKEDDIIFLRQIVPGSANRSYGVQVAKLAGVPSPVIARAKRLLSELEEADIVKHHEKQINDKQSAFEEEAYSEVKVSQLTVFDEEQSAWHNWFEEVGCLNMDEMTPMAAFNYLYELQIKIKQTGESF